MKRVDIDSELNPFFDATERYLIKFNTWREKEDFAEEHNHLIGSQELSELKTNVEYLIEIDYYSEYPYITVTKKDEILNKIETLLDHLKNCCL